jgi:riboflavin kinase/FMN adenylyltransferase
MIKIFNLNEFDKNKFQNFDLVCTIGNFDGFHLGHQEILNQMKEFSLNFKNPKLVLISFSPHTKLFFFPEKNFLISPEIEKIILAKNFGIEVMIDIPFNEKLISMNPEDFINEILIEKIGVKAIFVGEDFRFGKKKSTGPQAFSLEEYKKFFNFFSVKLKESPMPNLNESDTKNLSSSIIRNLISKNGNIELANKLLGYKFFMHGEVVHGFKRGKKIGFPTANILSNKEKILPKFGVYEVFVVIFENQSDLEENFSEALKKTEIKKFKAIANFGLKPTFSENAEPLLEAHILNFDSDIYGKTLLIFFENFIREEKKFISVDDLKIQIQKDINKISL